MAEGAEIARAYVLVVPSMQGAQKELTKELVPEAESASHEAGTRGGEKFKAALSAAAKAAAVAMAAAVGASVALIKSSLDAYAETEQLQGGIAKLFGTDAAETVLANASQAYKTAGLSANAYMQQVTGISAALLQSGVSAEEAAELADQALRQMADNANTFGTRTTEEIGQIYAALSRGTYSVLDSLSLGYKGSKEGMAQLIADANAYAKATGRAADLSIDSYADIVTAIGLVQEKLGIAGTTVNEAEQTISGSLSMLSAAWANFKAGLGDPNADLDALIDNVMISLDAAANNIIPAVDRIAKSLIRTLPDMVKKVAAWIPTVLPTVLEAVVTLATAVAEALPDIIESLVKVLEDNAEMLVDAAINIALALVAAAPRIINALAPAIPTIVAAVVDAIVEHIPDFITGAIDIVTALVAALPDIIVGLLDAIPGTVDKLVSAFKDPANIQKLIDAGKRLGNALVEGIISSIASSRSAIGATLSFDSNVMAGAMGVSPNIMAGGSTSTTTNYVTVGNVNANSYNGFMGSLRAAGALG